MRVPLLLVAVLLLALGPAARVLPPRACLLAGIGACALGLVLALAALALGPTGPWSDLDGFVAWMALAVLAGAGPGLLTGGGGAAALAGAALLAVLAAGSAPLLLALALVWLVAGRGNWLGAWAACAGVAVVLLALRVEGSALPALLLALVGLGFQWRGLLGGEAGAGAATVAALGVAVTAQPTLFLLGPEVPVWWGVLPVVLGLGGAVLGGGLACASPSLDRALPSLAVGGAGLACAGLGVAMAARAADALPLAGMGLEAALLQTLALTTALAALGLAAEPVRAVSGTAGFEAVGGLGATMPLTGLAALAATASLAALPPSAGFAGLYLLLQALFAACRTGGVWVPFGAACAVALVGLAAAATAFAALRLFGLAVLGRPRSELAAAAADPGPLRAGLATCVALVGLAALAGPGLLLLARPGLPVGAETPPVAALAPLAVAALLAALGAAAWAIARGGQEPRRVPAWEGGLPAAPLLAPYAPGLLSQCVAPVRRLRPRWPRLREWVGAAALSLAVTLLVLLAR